MTRSTEELLDALAELRNMHPALAAATPRSAPPTPEWLMVEELRKVHDFSQLLLDEVLELRRYVLSQSAGA